METKTSVPHIPDLSGYFGGYEPSECHPHMFRQGFHTPGVQALCTAAGAFWMVDLIMSYQRYLDVRLLGHLQTWKFVKSKTGRGCTAILYAENPDETERVVRRQRIEYTDFPFDASGVFSLWVTDMSFMDISGVIVTKKLIILPQEY
jgi:hypothetical protein